MTLKEARERKRLTQAQLAEAAGINQGTISLLELGRTTSPSWDVVAKLSRVLGVKPDALFPVEIGK